MCVYVFSFSLKVKEWFFFALLHHLPLGSQLSWNHSGAHGLPRLSPHRLLSLSWAGLVWGVDAGPCPGRGGVSWKGQLMMHSIPMLWSLWLKSQGTWPHGVESRHPCFCWFLWFGLCCRKQHPQERKVISKRLSLRGDLCTLSFSATVCRPLQSCSSALAVLSQSWWMSVSATPAKVNFLYCDRD